MTDKPTWVRVPREKLKELADDLDYALSCVEEHRIFCTELKRAPKIIRAMLSAADAGDSEALLREAQEELRLIRMKDSPAVYDPTLRARIAIFLSRSAGSKEGKLTKPAQVGNTIFGIGVSERAVIERAYRQHEYENTPEQTAERMGKIAAFVDAVSKEQPNVAPQEPTSASLGPTVSAESPDGAAPNASPTQSAGELTRDELEDRVLELARKYLTAKGLGAVTYTSWKDGIDIERASTGLMDFAQELMALRAIVPAASCSCGSPSTLNSVHRTDGPCFNYRGEDVACMTKTIFDAEEAAEEAGRPEGEYLATSIRALVPAVQNGAEAALAESLAAILEHDLDETLLYHKNPTHHQAMFTISMWKDIVAALRRGAK